MTTPEDSAPNPAPFTPPSAASGSSTEQDGQGAPDGRDAQDAAQGPTGGWGSPDGAVGYQQPRFGQYAPPGGPAPTGGSGAPGGPYPSAPPPTGGGWQSQPSPYGAPAGFGGPGFRAPSAKPGIIPLRPLGLGEIYDGAFGAIRSNPKVMLGVVALVVSVATIIPAIIGFLVAPSVNGWIADALRDIDPAGELTPADMGASISVSVLTALGVFLASIVTTGLLIVAIGRAVINRPFTAGDLWREVRGKVVGLLAIALLPGLALAVVAVAIVLLTSLLDAAVGTGAAGVVALLALLALVPVSVWVAIRVLLVPAAYVLEKQGVVAAFRRGWVLSRRSFWRLLGIYLLSNIIVNVVVGIIAVPGGVIAGIAFPADHWGGVAIMLVSNVVAYTITTAFLSAVVALLYIDVRMRREGLDVELAAAADEV